MFRFLVECLKIDFRGENRLSSKKKSCLTLHFQNQFLSLELILKEVKIFYLLSELLLEELPNINHFTSKSILTKLILTKLIRINFTKAEPNMHLLRLVAHHQFGTNFLPTSLEILKRFLKNRDKLIVGF